MMNALRIGIGTLALAGSACFAADATDNSPRGTVYVGLEVGSTDTQRVDAGTSWQFDEAWSAAAQIVRSEFEGLDETYASTLYSARIGHDFGPAALAVGVRRGEIEGIAENFAWFANSSVEVRTLRLGIEIEARDTDLAASPFTEDLGPGFGVRSGTSRCSVDSLGYQARVDLDRPSWVAFASWRQVDYGDFDCDIELASNTPGPPPHARGRALGRRLGALPLEPVSGFGSRLIPRDVVLLESSVAVGVMLPVSQDWLGGAEIYHDRERVGGSDFLTAMVFGNRRLSDTWTLELSLGWSDAETVDDTAFAGVRMTASL